MKKSIFAFISIVMIAAFTACGNKTKEENPEADSLRGVISEDMKKMDETDLFLQAVSTSMDSIVTMDGSILRTNKESTKSVKEQIKDNLEAYKMILKTQHERIALLEEKLKNGDAKSKKMLEIIATLKKQLQEKDQALTELAAELEKRDFDINTLKEHVEQLNSHVEELTETNRAQEEALTTQTNKMNEAYFFIGTKKELKDAGVLVKGKLSMSESNMSGFQKIDIRNTRSFSIPGKKPQILTQAPAGSYTITQNGDGTCTLTVTDNTRFWSLSHYLVIRY